MLAVVAFVASCGSDEIYRIIVPDDDDPPAAECVEWICEEIDCDDLKPKHGKGKGGKGRHRDRDDDCFRCVCEETGEVVFRPGDEL